jgi:hypothetical protein
MELIWKKKEKPRLNLFLPLKQIPQSINMMGRMIERRTEIIMTTQYLNQPLQWGDPTHLLNSQR